MESQEDTAVPKPVAAGHRLLDFLFSFILFGGLMLGTWSLIGPKAGDLFLFIALFAGVVTHYTSSFHHHQKAQDVWGELATLTPLQTASVGRPPRNPLRRMFRLDRLEGRRDGRPVTLEAEHLPFWRGGMSLYNWLIGRGLFETHLTVPVDVDEDLDVRLEKRKPGEKSYARLSGPGEPRTRFEREHHLFTDDEEFARRLLDERSKAAVEGLGHYESLRIEDGQVRLVTPGIPGPTRLERSLDMIVHIAKRAEAVQADRD